MRSIGILFSFIFLLNLSSRAQTSVNGKVVLCDSYDDYGAPTGIHSSWDIKSDGGYVYILYNQDRNISQELLLYVDKKNSNGSYVAYDTRYFKYDANNKKKFAVYDYKFTEAGDYKITVNTGYDVLASTYTSVNVVSNDENSENKKKASSKSNEFDTYYYEDSKITFGESIDANAVVSGEASSFQLRNGKRDIFCKIQQDKDLNITQLVVEVYGGDDYKEKIFSQTYSIPSKTWNWVKVPLSFTKPGKYVVDMYNENDIYLNSGYVDITE